MKQRRLALGWTQQQAADYLGVSQAAVSQWETGKLAAPQYVLDELTSANAQDVATEREQSFGEWLKENRSRQRQSVQELSENSQVSVPTIYSIESGRIQNPREETRKRLIQALAIPEDSQGNEAPSSSSTIEGLGKFQDFNPHEPEDRPAVPGVYVIYDVSDRPIYVGRSKLISRRLAEHEQKFWFRPPIVETASYIEIEDEALRNQIEEVLIKFLKSNAVINKRHVDRGD